MRRLVLVTALFMLTKAVCAQDADQPNPLKGVTGFYFTVSDLSDDMKALGFSRVDMEAIAQRALKDSAVPLLSSPQEVAGDKNAAILLLTIVGSRYGTTTGWPLIYYMQLSMWQLGSTARDPSRSNWMATWLDTGRTSWSPAPLAELPLATGIDGVIFAVENYITQFVVWYQLANKP